MGRSSIRFGVDNNFFHSLKLAVSPVIESIVLQTLDWFVKMSVLVKFVIIAMVQLCKLLD